ncbi:MAG TPA: DNA replication/repair protein RecF [Acidimicrobiia bacterium]|nr:DNA replication/repair protein RecF [Acidimicrobiia bacterium]
MHLAGLWLTDFRCYRQIEVRFPPGITVVQGANAQGKTSLLEAAAWAATGCSFRGVPDAALVRAGEETAILRAETVDAARVQLLEAEIRTAGRNRVRLNRQSLTRARDRSEFLRVTVFAPDDLQMVKGGPGGRRAYLDDLLVSVAPRYAGVRADYDRVLRQRNALLRAGVRTADDTTTLDVFDAQLARAGAELVGGRRRMLARLTPLVVEAYRELAAQGPVSAEYESAWLVDDTAAESALLDALRDRRRAELDRRVTLAGPHRDEWRLHIGALDSRLHASQGEQRTLALALRIAGHRLATEITGSPPVLLLDDVFSELDDARAAALLAHLDAGQTLVTTSSSAVPAGVHAEQLLRVGDGRVEEAA